MASTLFLLQAFVSSHFGTTGKNVQGVCFRGAKTVSCATHAARADPPLSLPVITDGGPPIVVGPNRSVGFRWNCTDNFGAVSKGAILNDQYFDRLCESFRRSGLPVHEITPAALSAETLGMRIIWSHGV